MTPEKIEKEIETQTARAAGEPGDAEARRAATSSSTTCGAPGRVPRGDRRAGLRPQLPAGRRSPPTSSATSARSAEDQLEEPAVRATSTPGDKVGPDRRRVAYDHLLRGQSTARPGSRSTPSAGPRASRCRTREPESGNNLRADDRLRGPGGRRGRDRPVRAARGVRRDGRRHGRGPRRWAPTPTFDPAIYTQPTISQTTDRLR